MTQNADIRMLKILWLIKMGTVYPKVADAFEMNNVYECPS